MTATTRPWLAVLAATAAAGASVWALAPVGAGAEVQGDMWTADWVTPIEDPASIAAPTDLLGWVRYQEPWTVDTIALAVVHTGDPARPVGRPVDLVVEEPEPPSSSSSSAVPEPGRVDFTFPAGAATPVCNGTYTVTVTATATPPGPSDAVLTKTLLVAIPPPPVTSVEAALNDDRTITVRWLPPDGYAPPEASTDSAQQPVGPPPDFTGYLVERSVSGQEWVPQATTAPGVHEFADTAIPATGGDLTYRVRALRVGAATGETVASPDAATATAAASVEAVARPASTGGRPLLRPRPRPSPPTTFDVVPDSEIPEPGEDDPVLPDDADELGGPIVRDVAERQDGRALLVPGASALLLVVWAMHIRYLSRLASRPSVGSTTAWLPDP